MFRKIRSEGLVFGQMLKIQELIWQSDCGRQSALTIFCLGKYYAVCRQTSTRKFWQEPASADDPILICSLNSTLEHLRLRN
jgi:hypothetical protein